MQKFFIQTINNLIRHDFSFQLLEAINYQQWINPNSSHFDYILCEKIDDNLTIPFIKN